MKKAFYSFLFSLITIPGLFAGVIVVEGKYQNKNLYVQNGIGYSGVGFCAYEVTINGMITTDEVNASSFEIDFSQFQIKAGTPVVVEIKHKEGCSPKVLNPDALKAKATFEVINISIDNNAILNWKTKKEAGALPYIIEQYRWNIWIPVGEVNGIGDASDHSYSFKITPHSGENKFRVKQVGYGDLSKTSVNATYNSIDPAPTFTHDKKKNTIQFSLETMFRIFDIYGNVTKQGYGNSIDITNLARGSYYLCYDKEMTDFIKN